MTDIHAQRILILDFGSQYTQLIARRVRELGVYCEIYAFNVAFETIVGFDPKGIILSGGPASVTAKNTPRAPEAIFAMQVPILGICYGMQTLSEQLGGKVIAGKQHELGHAQIQFDQASPLFASIEGNKDLSVWMSHGDQVLELPEGFVCAASTNHCPYAAMADNKRHFYGLQFHPEVTHTDQGKQLLSNFLFDIAGCKPLWTPQNIIDELIEQVRIQVGQEKVLLGLSGGVDSSVVAALLHKAIGDQLICVFVDNGLLRQDEGDQVMAMFAKNMGIRVIRVNAEDNFLQKLKGIDEPEAKRKSIGNTFIEIFEQQSAKLKGVKFLAQGTIYPDVIESAAAKTGTADVIKSHHNVGGLPENMQLELVEPLRELFKDEVRKIGLLLGLPESMIQRHPFPGPGLGVRILGEVKKEYADLLRLADAIFIEELHKANWYHKVSQAFAVFLPVKSVGVVGDGRRYEYVIALRAVQTIDFMTAHWAHLPYELLGKISGRIINEIPGVSRVTYDISGKPPATIEWE